MKRKQSGAEVFQISGAREGLTADVRARQRRYIISMSIRTVCVLLAVVLWHVQTVVAAIALVLGGVLPYVAVVIANGGRSATPPAPPAFVPEPTRYMLERGAEPESAEETGRSEGSQHGRCS